MNTFLPFADFEASAAVLDYRRLGKQRVEAFQILDTLAGRSQGWANHPAVRMWQGSTPALRQYMRACILEWQRRSYRNTMLLPDAEAVLMPSWLGWPDFHASHRSNLKRKTQSIINYSRRAQACLISGLYQD